MSQNAKDNLLMLAVALVLVGLAAAWFGVLGGGA